MPNIHLIRGLKKRRKPYLNKDLVSVVTRMVIDIKSKDIYKRISKYILGKRILDVGVGVGGINVYLKNRGFDVSGIDVKDTAVFSDVKVTIYDGKNIPFQDNSFDTALIIHVLHHCQDGLKVLAEAKRVAKRVIVVEDTYRDDFEKSVVSLSDNIGNWEFYEHPYHTSEWWEAYLKEQNYKIIHLENFSTLTYCVQYGRYVLFVIE